MIINKSGTLSFNSSLRIINLSVSSSGAKLLSYPCFFKRCSPWFTCPFTPNRNFPVPISINSEVNGKYLNLGSDHFKLKNPEIPNEYRGGSGGNAFYFVFSKIIVTKVYCTSLDRVLQRPLLFCLTYVEKYHTSTIFLVSYFWSVLQLVTRSRPHHGGQRLWPIPSPVPRRRPSRVRRHHPHTMGDDAYARLRCRPSVARAGADTPTIIGVPIFFLVAFRTIYRYK